MYNNDSVKAAPEKAQTLSQSGKIDGVTYSLNDLELNPNVIILNTDNSTLMSSTEDLSKGILKIATDLSLSEGDVLYVRSEKSTSLRIISAISKEEGTDLYELQTTQAQLGELFNGGDISFSLDLYEMNKILEKKNPQLRSSINGLDNTYEVLNLMDAYDLGNGLTYNPSTNVKMSLCIKMSFDKYQILPRRFETYFEIQPSINPLMTFSGAVNHIYEDDIIQFIPVQLIDFLKQQEFEFDIPINMLGIESIPAKVKIEDIHIPTAIEANLSKESYLTFGFNGSYKVGFVIDIVGVNAKATPIYENNIVANAPSVVDLYGELITESDVVITPNISILDNLYNVSGDIVFGLKTETNSNTNLPENPMTFGSKGIFTSRMTVLVDLILTKVPVNIFNEETEIWNVGSFDKKVVYSDISWKVTSKYSTNILLLSRLYDTDFTLNYKYPIRGKKIPNELLISYDVYQDNNKTKILSETDLVIVPTNVTDGSFNFKLAIPYKRNLLSYQSKSYLKNIVIKDRNGYVYEGVFNTAKGVSENSFEIKR